MIKTENVTIKRGIRVTGLRFSKKRMLKAILELNEYAIQSDFLLPDENLDKNDIERSLIDEIKCGDVSTQIFYNKSVIEEIHFVFPSHKSYKNNDYLEFENYIYFAWEKLGSWDENRKGEGWLLRRLGKPLCDEQYLDVIKSNNNFEKCECPVLNICRDMTQILKKNAYEL